MSSEDRKYLADLIEEKSRSAHFETFKDKANEWRWRLIASNGEPVAQSEAYTSQADATRGAQDAHRAALDASLGPHVVQGKPEA